MRHVAVLALLVPFAAPAQDLEVRSQWSGIFEERGVEGTIVVFDSATRRHLASDNLRSREQYVPASTFKIPHTLFALEAGVVSREPDVFHWDGSKQAFPAWERDQTLSTAFRASVPWVYQDIAAKLGEPAEQRYLREET